MGESKIRYFIFLLHMCLLCVLPICIDANTIVTDGLINYWTFDLANIQDGVAEDVLGENDAKIIGNPKIGAGYLRQGLKLDGLGDYVILDNVRNFSKLRGTFTFEIWIKTDNQSKWSPIFKVIEKSCTHFGGGTGIIINARLNFEHNDNNDRFIYTKDYVTLEQVRKTVNGGCSGSSSSFPITISDGNWHQFVYVYGPESNDFFGMEFRRTALYIDSQRKRKSQGFGSRREIYNGDIYIGAVNRNGKAVKYFRGVIDEVRIYDRELSQEEIYQNFLSKDGLTVDTIGKLPTIWGKLKHR